MLIALFGGLAGAVGLTRRAVTNVVPGVAIATALMPPLCTVGYGLGSGHYAYAAGALYLFFINSVYISLAAFLVVRFLNLPEPTFADAARKRQVHRITWTIALLTALPSVWFGYRLVHRAVFENNVRRFVDEQLTFPATYVVARQLNPAARTVNVLLAGKRLRASRLDSIRARLPDYRLADARLTIRQGMAAYDSADARALRASLLEDLQSRSAAALAAQEARLNQLQQLLTTAPAAPLPPAGALLREVRAEHPHGAPARAELAGANRRLHRARYPSRQPAGRTPDPHRAASRHRADAPHQLAGGTTGRRPGAAAARNPAHIGADGAEASNSAPPPARQSSLRPMRVAWPHSSRDVSLSYGASQAHSGRS